MSKLGLAYFALEQLDKALETFEKALETRKKVLQHDTLEIAKILNNIATVHYQKGDSKTAMKKLNEALNIMKQFMEGPIRRESIVYDTSVILSNMGKIHLERKKFEMAYLMLEEALMVSVNANKCHNSLQYLIMAFASSFIIVITGANFNVQNRS